ncbi:MAG: hypothetical protein L6W00_15585 [Lentisphaeria bacterium]|nr:MAG: hypothetical protein L6W00_15585 [Lentisphaeria bacterium]
MFSGVALSLSGAELLQEWNLGAEKVPGMRYPAKQVTFRPAEEKTPAGDPCGEFTILEAKEGSAPGVFRSISCRNRRLCRGALPLPFLHQGGSLCRDGGELHSGSEAVGDDRQFAVQLYINHFVAGD